MICAAKAFVTQRRMESLQSYLEASDAVLDCCIAYVAATGTSLCQRVEWTSEAADQQGAAAGCRRQAQAMLAPLVQRLRLTDDNEQGARLLALASTPPPLGQPLEPFLIAPPVPQLRSR